MPPDPDPDPDPSLLLLLLLIGTTATAAAGAASTNSTGTGTPPDCAPVSCGNSSSAVNITYPFWLDTQNASSSYCGYEGLGLTCSNGVPTLHTRHGDYTVLGINPANRTVSLADAGLLTGDLSCPFPPSNVSSDLLYTMELVDSDANLTFYLNCTLNDHLAASPRSFTPCLSSPDLSEYSFVLAPGISRPPLAPGRCQDTVVVPVMNSSIPAAASAGGGPPNWFAAPLRHGFQMRWVEPVMKDCRDCEGSGGRCYYSNSTGSGLVFDCRCANGVNCSSARAAGGGGGASRKPKPTWIIVAAAVGGFVLGFTALLVLYRRRFKPANRSASLSKLIGTASSEAYSMEKDVEALSQTHIFSYKELEEATEGFAESNELGDGGFGTVYKGKLRDGRVVAIKRLYENNFKREEQFMNEVAILNRLRHKNLVSLYGCTSRHSRGLLLVYEYVPNGTVADHLHGPLVEGGALTWPVRVSIAVETAGALAYLHAVEPQIIHRDVKTNNILLDENFHVKVADFGLSRLFPPDATHVSTVPQGTPGYLDPEYHQCYQLTDKSDVYSFGVVLAELISSKPAVDITRKRNEINLANMAVSRIQNCQLQEFVDPLLGYDSSDAMRSMIEQVAELAFRCLQAEKEMRPSMEEVLEVLKGITGTTKDHSHIGGKVDLDRRKQTDDCASLLNDNSVQYSPDTVHADWASRTTTPNTSGQAST